MHTGSVADSAPILTDGVVVLDGHTLDDLDAHLAGEDEEQARRLGWYPASSTPETVRTAMLASPVAPFTSPATTPLPSWASSGWSCTSSRTTWLRAESRARRASSRRECSASRPSSGKRGET